MEIVDFRPEHAGAFRSLNEAWIAKHFVIEAKDREVIENPTSQILDRGGQIFVALADGEPVGCVALIPMADGGLEVAKMTVAEALRGAGLGRKLMQRCIDDAERLGAPRLYLESNLSLAAARSLYLAMGFKDLPPRDTVYARCNVWMERPLG